jgi:hypothetical protein
MRRRTEPKVRAKTPDVTRSGRSQRDIYVIEPARKVENRRHHHTMGVKLLSSFSSLGLPSAPGPHPLRRQRPHPDAPWQWRQGRPTTPSPTRPMLLPFRAPDTVEVRKRFEVCRLRSVMNDSQTVE